MATKEDNIILDINNFPNGILALILQHLPTSDRLLMSTVCRRWNQLVFAFGDRMKLRLSTRTNYSVPIGKLSDRIYRNILVAWSKDNSNWMNEVENHAPNLFTLAIMPELETMNWLHRWNPSPSQMEQFQRIVSNLGALRTLVINTTQTAICAILEAIPNLPNLKDFGLEVGNAESPYDNHLTLSIFNGLCRLPKLRAVRILTRVNFYPSDDDYLAPSPVVEKFKLEQCVPYFSILKFSNLFPRLTQLNIGQVVLDPDELKLVVRSWPALEVLVLGLNSTLLNTSSFEIIHMLTKLRRLELKPLINFKDGYSSYEHLMPDLLLLETVFRMPSLKEVHLFHGNEDRVWWAGQVPKGAPSCRLYINGKFKPRTSPTGTVLHIRSSKLRILCDADEEF